MERKSKIFTALLFLYLWLMVGFFAGTLTLIGPVRWTTSLIRAWGLSQSTEDLIVKVIIALYVLLSIVISLWLVKIVKHIQKREIRIGIVLIVTLLAAGALYLWMNPSIMIARQESQQIESVQGPSFTFGSYPGRDRLIHLRNQGYTAIISLLHPAVVPFEPKLLSDEKALIKEIGGIEFIHIPMLPWVGQNEDSLNKIRGLAQKGKGRYYVHCYLGKDRVNLVKRIVEQAGAQVDVEAIGSDRRLSEEEVFERGKIFQLEKDVYLTPYPTDEEFLAYILTGEIKSVVSLLDPTKDADLIKKERELLEGYKISFNLFPITSNDHGKALEVAKKVRELPRSVVVHAFLSDPLRSPTVKTFLEAYKER